MNKFFLWNKGKKPVVIFLTMIFISTSISTFNIVGAEDGTEKILEFTFNFQEPKLKQVIIEGREFTEINMKNTVNFGNKVGSPVQQTKSVKILLPYETEIEKIAIQGESIDVDIGTYGIDLIEKPVVPHQKSMPLDGGPPDDFAFNESAYNLTEPVQESNYENVGVGSCRGYSILTLNLNPIEYIPAEGKLSYYPKMSLTIELKANKNVNELYRTEYSDQDWVKALVINPEVIISYPTVKLGSNLYTGGLCDPSDNGGEGYDYVIVTKAGLVDFTAAYNWTDFINRKQAVGLDTTIVSYEDIVSCPDYYNATPLFNDSAAKIREFCRDAYQDWGLKYILIAGDDEGVASIPRREMDSYGEYNVESDLYWSNLDNNFNADQDNYWGEEGDSGFDLYSELWIGSITCDTGQDISNWMTKSFYYADSWEQDYLENAAFYGGNTGWSCQGDDFIDFTYYGSDYYFGPDPNHDGPFPDFLGFVYGWDTWNSLHPEMAFNTSVKWTAEPPNAGWQGGSESAAINGLKNDINNDLCTLISGIAHASSSQSLDVYASSWESDYHNTKPFFLHDYGCHCGDMDASDDGVLHSMLFHSDTELAFATVYNTGYGWGNLYCTNSSSAWQQKLFWDYMFNLNKSGGIENWQLGKAQAYSKDEMAQMINWDYYDGTFREIIQCCLLFGDPAQTIKPPTIPDRKITDLEEDWNLVSIQFNASISKLNLTVDRGGTNYSWTDAVTNGYLSDFMFDWDRTAQSYTFSDVFNPSKGYWLYSYDACDLWIENLTIISGDSYITQLEPGWNIVSIPHDENIDKSDIIVNDVNWDSAVTNGWISDYVFGWNRAGQYYDFADIFIPGFSYWVYASQASVMERDI